MVRIASTPALLPLAVTLSLAVSVPVSAQDTTVAQAAVPAAAPQDSTAQSAAPPAPAASGEAPAEALGPVVVTAQKRQQNLQDVPIAVTAFSASQIESHRIEDVTDLSALAPGLQVEASPANGSISQVAIRGNVEINPAIYWDPAIGIYLDGVYLGKSQGSIFDVVNLERIEVLRGPQGTLYGRNTIGGAISLVTRQPSGQFGGDATLEIGNYNSQVEKLSLDLPKFGIASISLGATMDHRDGWVSTTPDSSVNSLNNRGNNGLSFAVNLALLPGLQADYRFDHTDIDTNGDFGQLYRADASYFDYLSTLSPAYSSFSTLPNYASQTRQTVADVNAPSFEKVVVEGHSLTLTWNPTERDTVKSISAYRHVENSDSADYDGSPLAIAATQRYTQFHQLSQELQWVGRAGPLNYTGGLYYYHDDGYTNNPQTFFAGTTNYDSEYGTRTDAWAPYGQVDWHVIGGLTLTAGLRYTEELKALDRIFGYNTAPGSPYTYLIPAGTHADARFEATTPSFTAAYQFNRGLNAYVRYAEGFKSGGFNGEYSDTTQSSAANIAETQTPFKPEKQRSLELGLKSTFADGRAQLNVALFQDNVKDMQVSIFTATGAAASIISNAGDATVRGAEVEAAFVPVRGTRVSFNYAYLEAYYNTFVDDGQNVPDDRAFVHAPHNTFNVTVDSKLWHTRYGVVEGNVDYTWTGSYYLYPYQLSADPSTAGYDDTKQFAANSEVKSYGLLNMRLALAQIPLSDRASGELAIWGHNLTNQAVATNFIDFGPGFGNLTEAYFMDPLTFGGSFTVHF